MVSVATQLRYLDALGIPVWKQRAGKAKIDLLHLGPGSGSTLMVCEHAQATATAIAADISRFVGADAAWAWPLEENSETGGRPGMDLTGIIEQNLITTVLVFGEAFSLQLMRGFDGASSGSARFIQLDDFDRLKQSAKSRRQLWQKIAGLGSG